MSLHALPDLSAVDRDTFRNAMAQLGAAVNVITTDGPAGVAGFTASAVCSVTDSPPTLLVCLNRSASAWPAFRDNRALCVNTLTADQHPLSTLFGGKTAMADRFAAAQWQTLASGAPLLEAALISFDCEITQRVSVGTHDILFCTVLAVAQGEARQGLAWFDRGYHTFSRQDAR